MWAYSFFAVFLSTFYCVKSQNGHSHLLTFKNLAAFTQRFLKCLTIVGCYALKG